MVIQSIRVGEASYIVLRPEDLETQLRTDLGVGEAETGALLAGEPLPSTIARALIPFLPDAPAMAGFAHAIAEAGTADVLVQARELYGVTRPEPPAPPEKPKRARLHVRQ